MTCVMTYVVRDEEDILHQNMRYHLERGVDHLIVTDNLSTDATPDIVQEFVAQGVATYVHEPSEAFAQGAWMTRMAHQAKAQLGAKWVINNDADEFWMPRHGSNIRTAFDRIWAHNIVEAARHDFVCVEEADRPFWDRMVYRKRISFNPLGRPLPPKRAHRAASNIIVGDGSHKVRGMRWPRVLKGAFDIMHFPIRSREQYYEKIRVGSSALAKNEGLHRTTGVTWRRQGEELDRTGRLKFVEDNALSDEQLSALIADGNLVRDTRVREVLAPIYA